MVGFRYFDWELGRFITRDPSGYPDGPNPYVYCSNNPINHIDPLGLESSIWNDFITAVKNPVSVAVAGAGEFGRQANARAAGVGTFIAKSTYYAGSDLTHSVMQATGVESASGYTPQSYIGEVAYGQGSVVDKATNIAKSALEAPVTVPYEFGKSQLGNDVAGIASGNGVDMSHDTAVQKGESAAGMGVYVGVLNNNLSASKKIGAGAKTKVQKVKNPREAYSNSKSAYAQKKAPSNTPAEVSTKGQGLTTPKKYFSSKTKAQVSKALEKKYGVAKGQGKHNKSYYNSKTKRTFNVHEDPAHRGGKPHVDVKRRGVKNTKVYKLKEE